MIIKMKDIMRRKNKWNIIYKKSLLNYSLLYKFITSFASWVRHVQLGYSQLAWTEPYAWPALSYFCGSSYYTVSAGPSSRGDGAKRESYILWRPSVATGSRQAFSCFGQRDQQRLKGRSAGSCSAFQRRLGPLVRWLHRCKVPSRMQQSQWLLG